MAEILLMLVLINQSINQGKLQGMYIHVKDIDFSLCWFIYSILIGVILIKLDTDTGEVRLWRIILFSSYSPLKYEN